VIEEHPELWGGISRTEEYKGYRFDIGGHRFFSKSDAIEALWDEILPEPLLERPRKSRIYYRGRFYSYPLRPFEALRNLGILESVRCVGSYLRARLLPISPVSSFEDWVTNAFGKRLFGIFFKTYTEKVWGMPCREISADWAAQRIKGLSLSRAVLSALVPRAGGNRADTVKTLISTFRYPRLGPGMMWEGAASRIATAGGKLVQGERVTGLEWSAADSAWRVTTRTADGELHTYDASDVVSTMPLRELVQALEPAPPHAVLVAAGSLRYRDFMTVALIVKDRGLFDDNWIYIHDPAVQVGRVQNFKSWSPAMVPDGNTACFGLEYFCHQGDGLWDTPDEQLIGLAAGDMAQLGLMRKGDLIDGTVVRQIKAYPVYDAHYAANVETVRTYLEATYPTLYLAGRNGMHKYNNQDHAMMTALLAAQNILAGRRVHDAWRVNEDAEYHEEGSARGHEAASGLRAVPVSGAGRA
jgi:protoporphyrinogen oxidase